MKTLTVLFITFALHVNNLMANEQGNYNPVSRLTHRILDSIPPAPAFTHIKAAERDLWCLAINLYHEARNEPELGIRAVGHVTLNRVRLRKMTVCRVVFQNNQFSWANRAHVTPTELKPEWIPDYKSKAWVRCKNIANDMLINPGWDYILGAEYYHATYIKPPKWTKNMVSTGIWGLHIFYVPLQVVL